MQNEQKMAVFSTCGLFQIMIPALTLEALLKILNNSRMDSIIAELHVLVFKILIKHKH